ncbi:unnamed protein product [Durusdinium trenchii]|uniref:Uncharacterized protein n=1 Tax=Durusdinium trenchii TaxID=1381693 RepID=A0ABP0P6V4_9DINO
MPNEALWECLTFRLWNFLEAPADLPARAACRCLKALPCRAWSGGTDPGELPVPHLALSLAAVPWAQRRICLGALESLTCAGVDGHGEGHGEGLFRKILCWFVKVGDLPWVLWLLTSEPRPGDAARRGISDVAPSAGLRATLAAHGAEALRVAAGAGQLGVLEMLLEASADVTATDENECTALHWAADQGHAEACELLLVFGAPIDEEDDDAWTPLCLAAEEGHLKTCSILLAYGASVSIPDEDLRSPLWWAAWRKHFDLVQLLLKHRADPNQIDRWGVSPRKILNDECPTVI